MASGIVCEKININQLKLQINKSPAHQLSNETASSNVNSSYKMQLATIGQQETVNHLGEMGSPLPTTISPSKFMFQLDGSTDSSNMTSRSESDVIEQSTDETAFDLQQCTDTAMSLIASGLHNSDLIEITELPSKSLTNGQSNVVLTVKFPDNVKFAGSKETIQQNDSYTFQTDMTNQIKNSQSMKENSLQGNQTKQVAQPSIVSVCSVRPPKKIGQPPDTGQTQNPSPNARKSQRPRKPPTARALKGTFPSLAVERTKKKMTVKPGGKGRPRKNVKSALSGLNSNHPDFKCDRCGSRYIINPMRRGSKMKMVSYQPAPRHKVDPETQEILTLCNACGLSFGREKKQKKPEKVEVTEEDRKKFLEEGQAFGKELATKLSSEQASQLFCSLYKKIPCGCIQKYICGQDHTCIDELLHRANELLEMLQAASQLKKLKCYDESLFEGKPKTKRTSMIGLGNGHRRSKQFEDFVLTKREYLRNTLKLCERGTQKILLYSNNFLHKRLKTDPEKLRIDRQKGKASLGTLIPVQDLPLESCCADNCVRMALSHSRLLEQWRSRAAISQCEARRVLAEMLTPSGGNRANCYRFVAWVTGCSNTTIGKVNEQMKTTGGDREPPEHGLKKYWKESKQRKDGLNPNFNSHGGILQQAANMAGLSDSLVPNTNQPPPQKKAKRERKPKNTVPQNTIDNHCFVSNADGCIKTELIQSGNANGIIQTNEEVNLQSLTNGFNGVQTNDPTSSIHNLSTGNMQNLPTTILQLNNSAAAGQGFITIPTALAAGSTITIPNCLSIQTIQQQLQQQQQLQLQIQLLQQQLQASQAASQSAFSAAAAAAAAADPEYMINVSGSPDQSAVTVVSPLNGSPGDGIVKQPLMGSADANQTLSSINVMDTDTVLPRVVTNTQNLLLNQEGLSLINTPQNVKQQNITNAVSLLSSPTSSADVINSYQPVTLITAPSQTMSAVSQQPVAISLQQNTPLSLSNLPTMLTLGPHTVSQPHQITLGPQTMQQTQQQHIIVQTNTVNAQPAPSFNSTPATMLLTPSGVQPLITSTALNQSPSTVLLAQSVVQAQPLVHTVVQQQPLTQTLVQQQPLTQTISRRVVQAQPAITLSNNAQSITLNNNAQHMLIAHTSSERGMQQIRTAPQIIVNTGSTNNMRVSSAQASNIQISSSASPHPVSSFNADSFLAGESSYSVLSNANMAQIQPRQTDSSSLQPMQVSFIQTSL